MAGHTAGTNLSHNPFAHPPGISAHTPTRTTLRTTLPEEDFEVQYNNQTWKPLVGKRSVFSAKITLCGFSNHFAT